MFFCGPRGIPFFSKELPKGMNPAAAKVLRETTKPSAKCAEVLRIWFLALDF